jgi:hypothetical protein
LSTMRIVRIVRATLRKNVSKLFPSRRM